MKSKIEKLIEKQEEEWHFAREQIETLVCGTDQYFTKNTLNLLKKIGNTESEFLHEVWNNAHKTLGKNYRLYNDVTIKRIQLLIDKLSEVMYKIYK